MFPRFLTVLTVMALFSVAFAQEPAQGPALGYEDSLLANYAANVLPPPGTVSWVNITNSGFHASAANPTGNICVNVYVFGGTGTDVDQEQPVTCCTCLLTKNEVKFWPVFSEFVANSIIPPPLPTSITIKLLATVPTGTAFNSCDATRDPTLAAIGTQGGFASGLRAWGTHTHIQPGPPAGPGGTTVTENAFEQVPLSSEELQRDLLGTCRFINTFGSGHGICSNCRSGAAAPTPQLAPK